MVMGSEALQKALHSLRIKSDEALVPCMLLLLVTAERLFEAHVPISVVYVSRKTQLICNSTCHRNKYCKSHSRVLYLTDLSTSMYKTATLESCSLVHTGVDCNS